MQKAFKNIITVILLLFKYSLFSLNAQNVEVVITGIRSSEGTIIIGVYKDEQSFKEDKPFIRKSFKKGAVSNGEMKVKLNLTPGTYGFALLDDENNDDVMNYNIIGIPKEGFGFSNYYLTSLTRPKFDSFKFVLKENQKKTIRTKIKYM